MQHWQLHKMHESEIDERNMVFSIQDTHKSNPVLRNQAISLRTPKTSAFDTHKILKPITPVPPRDLNHLFTIFYHLPFPLWHNSLWHQPLTNFAPVDAIQTSPGQANQFIIPPIIYDP